MDHAESDRNLLIGVVAVQMGFVASNGLIAALDAWVLEPHRPLGEILVSQGALSARDREVVEAMVAHRRQGDDLGGTVTHAWVDDSPTRSVDPDLTQLAPARPASVALVTPAPHGGRYHVLRPHARGGIGQVSVAMDAELNREVALKEIQPGEADDPNSRARFVLEAEVTGQLEHPGIVPVYGLGEDDRGRPFYAMRFIRGESLKDAIERFHRDENRTGRDPGARTLELRKLLRRFLDVCNAVAYAHSRGVIHRDIKPANIMLGPYGETLVVDWGLAKLIGRDRPEPTGAEATLRPAGSSGSGETVAGTAIGTPAFMSLEQAQGDLNKIGPATDIFSRGATLYCLLAGRPPYEGRDAQEALDRARRGEFVLPRRVNGRIPQALEAVTLKAMAMDSNGRYLTVRALAEDLEHWLADEPVSAHREPIPARVARWARRHKPATVGLAALLVTAVVALAISTLVVEREQARTVRQLYINRVNLAYRECLSGNIPYADRLLDECPRALRGWEWEFCRGLCHREALNLVGHGSSSRLGGDLMIAMFSQGILGASYSPDGRRIATAGADGTVRIWDATTGAELQVLRGHEGVVRAVKYRPDGGRVASSGDDGTVRVWDTATGAEVARSSGSYGIGCLDFSPDGLRIAAGRGSTIEVTDANSGQLIRGFVAATNLVTGVAFAPDGVAVASSSFDGIARLSDSTTGREIRAFRGHRGKVYGVAFSPDGRRVASCSEDRTVRIWDATTGAEIQTLRGHRNWVCGVAFSPDSRFVASAGWDGVARLWDAASGEELATYRCHAPRVYGVAFSPSGDRLVTAGEDRIARVWDVAGDADALTFGDQDGFWQTAATFSPDGRRVAVGTFGNLKVRDAATGEILLVVPTTFYFNNNDLAYSPNGRRIVSCREGGPWVDLRDAETGRRIALTAAHNGVVHAVAFRPDGRRFASIARDGSIKEWDADDGRAIRTLPGHAGGGFGLAYNPDGTTLASVGWDGTVRLWDAADGGPRGVLLGASRGQHNYHGNPLAFSPDGRRIATTTEDGTVAVWDIAGGRRVLTLRGHTGEVNDVAFSPDGRRIATAGADATIKLWAAADGMEVFTLRGHGSSVLTVGYSPDGRRIVSSSIDGTVKVWDPDPIAPAVARSRWISARAEPIVMNLFNAKELMKDEVLGRLRESSLGEPLRSAALRIAGRWREDSEILNQRAWLLVRGVGQDRGRYLTGLRWAEAAHRLAPEDSNVQNTLAMALYRVDHFQEALDLASRARPGNDVLYHGTHPTDLALIAMAHHRLGHREESRAIMDELRLLMKNDRWREEPEARQFLSEAEWTLSDR